MFTDSHAHLDGKRFDADRDEVLAWVTTAEVDFPKVCELAALRIWILAKANQAKAGSKGRQLVHGRPLLMVRHFLRSTERHKLHQRILSAKTVRTTSNPRAKNV